MAKMGNDKKYIARHEQLARFAKVWGHSVRIAIVQFLAKQNTCYFCGINELSITKATVFQNPFFYVHWSLFCELRLIFNNK